MKSRIEYVLAGVLAVMMSACSKENVRTEPQPVLYQVDGHHCANEQDESVMHLARAIGRAVRSNGDLRTMIRDKAVEQFDGDYDVLLSHVKKTPIRVSDPGLLTKGEQEIVSFADLIASYYEGDILTKSEAGSILDELVAAYPELQVSVPVHAEEWDPETYAPAVVFVTTEMDPDDLEDLPGYDADGNAIEMDARIAPSEPVIVVGYNERIIRDTTSFVPDIIEVPLAPVLGDIYQTNQSVILNWSLQTPSLVDGYDVWKKGPGATAFSKVASIETPFQRTYEDTEVLAGYTY